MCLLVRTWGEASQTKVGSECVGCAREGRWEPGSGVSNVGSGDRRRIVQVSMGVGAC